ncbi:hypothetical protein AB1K91_01910 [Terribacillus sp. 179-K 1B1 HS]|uniref:hypothetical protein n=1 Tax=Terribacillus sp. 179-K 1B1 HS TaxID=3142388 RepID=UPI0039A2774D
MKFRYTESVVKEAFRNLVLHNSNDTSGPIPQFKMMHPVMGMIKKANGEKSLVNCVMDTEEEGLLIVPMHLFRADIAIAAWYFSYSSVQHLDIKDGWLQSTITLKSEGNAGEYVYQIRKRSPKNLPNQEKNLKYLTACLTERFNVSQS